MLPPDDTKSTDIVNFALSFINGEPKFMIQGYYNVTSINYSNFQTNILF